ncbi:MAG: yceA [Fibrobacteres bacterium]|nr:yceA [Fibrobacterota bacterium]
MPLYNTLSAAQRAKLIDEAGKERLTVSFYKYHRLEDPRRFRDEWFAAWEKLDVLGRIYVAHEGVNAQLSVPGDRFGALKEQLDGYPFLRGIRLNIAVEHDNKSFLKLKVKVRNRIVADGIEDESFDAGRTGAHLKALEFNRLIEKPDTILVDMRNHFESEIGHFKGALKPDVDTFRASLDIIEAELKDHREDKNLVMYCTGGIRCEKASAWFRHKGFKSVYQLEGGIIEYLRQVKEQGLENKFMGKNYVFDNRMAERISADIVSTCHLCDAPCDTHNNCRNEGCHILMIQCAPCAGKLDGCCSEACRAVAALPLEEQKRMRKGIGAPKKYFKRSK